MATSTPAPASPVTLEEYLRTSYRPDVEFIDGRLGEKPMGTWDHGRVKGLTAGWFLQHRREWGVRFPLRCARA